MKRMIWILVIAIACVCAYGLLNSNIAVIVDGEHIIGTDNILSGALGILIAAVTIISVSVLLAFIFSGIFMLLLSIGGFVIFLITCILFPFFIPILIPILIILLVCSGRRKEQRCRY